MYSKENEPQVSDKDILCLKILEVVEDANHQKVYLTPYANMRITPDMLSGKTLIEPEYNYDVNKYGNYARIKEGFIHTFDYDMSILDLISNIEVFGWLVLERTERTLRADVVKQLGYPYYTFPNVLDVVKQLGYPYYTFPNVLNVTLCKCVIPAGTPFFRGSEHSNPYFENHYASKAIRVTKILHEFTKEYYMEKDENKIYNFIKDIVENS